MKIIKHLFVSDFHIPDHNKGALKSLLKFIPDFAPDHIHILGDFLNFTKASDYLVVGACPSLWEEIKEGRAILYDLVTLSRKANKDVEIEWYCGNHSFRLEKYLASGDNVLTDIEEEDGELLVSIPHIFNLKKLRVKWIPYYKSKSIGPMILEHGMTARSKAGYTAQAQIDKYGRSGASGHTHKLSLVAKRQYDQPKFWMEVGCMCNPDPTPQWVKNPDFVNGFGVGIYDPEEKILHPFPILMQENQFYWNGKLYGK